MRFFVKILLSFGVDRGWLIFYLLVGPSLIATYAGPWFNFWVDAVWCYPLPPDRCTCCGAPLLVTLPFPYCFLMGYLTFCIWLLNLLFWILCYTDYLSVFFSSIFVSCGFAFDDYFYLCFNVWLEDVWEGLERSVKESILDCPVIYLSCWDNCFFTSRFLFKGAEIASYCSSWNSSWEFSFESPSDNCCCATLDLRLSF